MRSAGYTLIELLVVISIIGILSVVAFVNIRDFSSAQALKKAAGDVQSFLRLAQSNATSSTFCNKVDGVDVYGVDWKVVFSSTQLEIKCGSADTVIKTLDLQNGIIIKTPLPSPVVYSALKGVPNIGVTIELKNPKEETKTVTLTSGGAINVQ